MLMLAIAVSLSNFMLETTFKSYVEDLQDKKMAFIVKSLSLNYDTRLLKWDRGILDLIGKDALENNLLIRIKDDRGIYVWDALNNNATCGDAIKKTLENIYSRSSVLTGKYVEKSFPINVMDMYVGSVEIGYYVSKSYSDDDKGLINRLNLMYFLISAFSLIIATIAGMFISREISMPISKVTEAVSKISKSEFKDKLDFKSNIFEIESLLQSINNLVMALDNDKHLRKRLATDVAHELRTPVSVLQSHLEAMIEGVWKPSKERLESCYDEVIRLGKLVENLKRLADLDNGNFTVLFKEFSIHDLIKTIYLNFEADFKKKNIDFSYDVSYGIEIISDKDKLGQILVNLISNAYKYTNAGGRVEIKGFKQEDAVIIIVKDTGVGISEKDLPFIFERFYRTDASRTKTTGGSGIGLSVVSSLIKVLNGNIEVSSQIGKGSEFKITLPV